MNRNNDMKNKLITSVFGADKTDHHIYFNGYGYPIRPIKRLLKTFLKRDSWLVELRPCGEMEINYQTIYSKGNAKFKGITHV